MQFGSALAHEGFSRVADRKWLRRRSSDIADLFEIQAMKGASYSPLWGFSLSYVPHISGSSLRFHRADKSSRLDYFYDPLDKAYGSKTEYEAWYISSLSGLEWAQRSADRVAAKSIPLALGLFSQVARFTDLVDLYADSLSLHRSGTLHRFGFFNYTQFPIAYAFTLARLGHYNEGVAILQEAMQYGIDYQPVIEKLYASMRRFEKLA